MLAPVVIFVYNRPDHTKSTIEALAKNKLAQNTEVFIYSDAAKNESSEEKVEHVRKYIDSLSQKNFFKSINIVKANTNKGLANSVIAGVSEVIEKYGKAIVVEDDLVSSPDFLQYMNEALDFYEKEDKIWSISGYSYNLGIPSDYKSEVYFTFRGCSWGWATWKNRWDKVDWNVSDYNEFRNSKVLRKNLRRGGRDMAIMLDAQMQGEVDSWAIRWCYSQSKLDMLTVYPVVSRIKNIGLDGSGTHSGVTSHFDTILNFENKRCAFEQPKLDKRILKNFNNYYMPLSEYLLTNTKLKVKKLLRK
jgi:hypothetical protein